MLITKCYAAPISEIYLHFPLFHPIFFVSYGLILFHFHKLIHRNNTAETIGSIYIMPDQIIKKENSNPEQTNASDATSFRFAGSSAKTIILYRQKCV